MGVIRNSPHPRSCAQGKIVFLLKKKSHSFVIPKNRELTMRAAYIKELIFTRFTVFSFGSLLEILLHLTDMQDPATLGRNSIVHCIHWKAGLQLVTCFLLL